jgi:adenine/guanine/hypoxanthine permease
LIRHRGSNLTPVLDRYFGLSAQGTTASREVRAGLATFLTMAYILLVNPQILAEAGMPAEDVAIATALSAALATLVMGLWARYPFAQAPGMGLNAYFAFGVVLGAGVSWQVALAAVFIEGLLFLLLAIGGIRTRIINAIPLPLKVATTAGIGLFLAVIGFQNAGITVASPATLVTLGDLANPGTLLALAALVAIAVLMARRVPGAILIGILGASVAAWSLGLAALPDRWLTVPSLPSETLLAMDFGGLLTGELLAVVIAFLFVDLFDTAGTLLGIGRIGGFTDEAGELPRADRAFTADALGTMAGAALGTSTVTTYIESAAGIEEGGRTGLTAVTTAALFLLALFVAPVFTAIPAFATAPALIVVGALMTATVRDVDWTRIDTAVPAFLTMVAMPFTYSIANGIALGIVSFAVIRVLLGRWREVHPILYILAALLALYYGFLGI